MGVAIYVELTKLLERETTPISVDGPEKDVTPENLSDFEVEQVRRVQRDLWRGDAGGNLLPGAGVEQELENRRSIDDDQRRSRSSRSRSAGDGSSSSFGRRASLASSCCRVGRSSERWSSRRMNSDIDMPARAARALTRRWTSDGTFRICIMVDMLEQYFHVPHMSIE